MTQLREGGMVRFTRGLVRYRPLLFLVNLLA